MYPVKLSWHKAQRTILTPTAQQTASPLEPLLENWRLEGSSKAGARKPRRQNLLMDSSSWKFCLRSMPMLHTLLILPAMTLALADTCPSGIALGLTDAIMCRYERSYDLAFVQRRFAGKRFIALNILWHYKEQASFPVGCFVLQCPSAFLNLMLLIGTSLPRSLALQVRIPFFFHLLLLDCPWVRT